MTTEAAVRAHFRSQADACRRRGSAFTDLVLTLAADRLDTTEPVGARVLGWTDKPGEDALGLRFAGGLHGLVLDQSEPALAALYPPNPTDPDRLWLAVRDALVRHSDRMLTWLDLPPQTNEVGRAAATMPGMLLAARMTDKPIRLLEIGASAGINLHLDRFQYRYGDAAWGDPASPVVLTPDLAGTAPDLSGMLEIIGRSGIDLDPRDPGNAIDRLRLMSYVWPDQPHRHKRLVAALDLATDSDLRVQVADAADAVEAFATPEPGVLRLLVHTVVEQYLPEATKSRIRTAMTSAGVRATQDAPVGWLSMERGPDREAELRLRLWPQGIDAVLARCDYHGRWIDWLASG